VFIEAKDDGSGGDNWATGAISRANSSQIITSNKPTSALLYRADSQADTHTKNRQTYVCLDLRLGRPP